MIRTMTLEEFQKICPLFIHNIQEGFSSYPNGMLEGSSNHIKSRLLQMIELNGEENCFTDCYFARLNIEEKKKIQAVLTDGEYHYLEGICLAQDKIYQSYHPVLFDILFKLTTTEMLFSTFYFTKYPCLIWGNYDGKYPVFCLKEEDLTEKYLV